MKQGLDIPGRCSEGSGVGVCILLTGRGTAEPTWDESGMLVLPVAGGVRVLTPGRHR